METNIKETVAKLKVVTWPDIQFVQMALNNEFSASEVVVKRSALCEEIKDYGSRATRWKLAALGSALAIGTNLVLALIFDINDHFIEITVGLGMIGMIAHQMYSYAAKDFLDSQLLSWKLTELNHENAKTALELCQASIKADMWRRYSIERRGNLLTGDIDVMKRLSKIDKKEKNHEQFMEIQKVLHNL